ncbi:MAG: lipid-A-disaccharide synthase [Phycisphaerae bacterium]|mgnify:CR=1 FL=1|nr:MAG: lipid-A-disaccharide synthase [Phycisphaerae bacterium]
MDGRIFFTVGEVSGDNHAAGVIRALKTLKPDLNIEGIGGPRMAQAGATIHFETTTRAAMSFHAVKRVREIHRLERWLKARYRSVERPDLHVCVDSSGFNLRFARLAKSQGIKTLYFVAPQLWASREGRIQQLRDYVDRLACIFPFEEQWFGQRGVNATFVGHPLFDQLPENRLQRVPHHRFPDRDPVIGVVAGSRRSEVKENLPGLIRVMQQIRETYPGVRYRIPTTVAGDAIVRQQIQSSSVEATIRQDAFDELIPECDLVLCKSGTSTVHVAAYGVPMIVVYRVNTLVWKVAGQFLIKTPKIAMVNILAGNVDLVPEYIPWNGDPEPITREALELLRHPERLEQIRRDLLDLVAPFDRRGACEQVARMALHMMNRER